MSDYKADSNIDFKGVLSEPSANIDFGSGDGAPKPYIPNANFDFTGEWLKPNANFDFGEAQTTDHTILPVGIEPLLLGFPSVRGNSVFIDARGIYPPNFDNQPSIRNKAVQIKVSGFLSESFNNSTIYNYLTFTQVSGIKPLDFGLIYLQGGVRYLNLSGIPSNTFGTTLLKNTTANQDIKPAGVPAPYTPAPNVYPLTVYAKGFNAVLFGSVNMQRSPMPMGEDWSAYGDTTVWYHTRPLAPNGISAFESGYPVVFDPAQEVQVPSLVETGIFGDTRAINKSAFVYVDGITEPPISDYINIESNRRYIKLAGIDSQLVPVAEIRNKTPSLFVDGIAPSEVSKPSVSYKIRRINVTGFDLLALGKPILTKTPELKAFGGDSLSIGAQTVWCKNRSIAFIGKEMHRFSEPTVWFRYRYAKPSGIYQEVVSRPVVTHGVREVLGLGYSAAQYGYGHRVSYGIQYAAPASIYQDLASNHFVGRHQNITAIGFDASSYGTRIIPEATNIYPLGFINPFGQTTAGLYINYLQPRGFVTAGQRLADRWGYVGIYNLTQHIQQDYDVNSGLNPPVMEGWTLIENRDKTIGAIGLPATRYGYSSIENGARPLLPAGVIPPTNNKKSMITHSIRALKTEGIEAPLISTWGVVYNNARVIAPVAADCALYGNPLLESNRRYYQWIGAIDSAEYGVPMIADRIRFIDIETRYSIGPPQINLPTVDLHTRYVSFNGYETATYGSPSLSIHLRELKPRWARTDRIGYAALKNVTPEIPTFGHNSEEYGTPAVRTQWRDVTAVGSDTQLFGKPQAADSKRQISVMGWHSLIINSRPVVTKTGVPAYGTQVISLDVWFDYNAEVYRDGFGIEQPNNNQKHRVQSNSIFPTSITSPVKVGTPSLTANSIFVTPGYHELLFGNNKIINSKQGIALGVDIYNKEKEKIDSQIVFGKPRLSPHTIYSVVEAPRQAIDNHELRGLHMVDYLSYEASRPIKGVGTPSVESNLKEILNATIYNRESIVSTGAKLTLKNVVLSIKGIPSPMMGVPEIPFSDQYAVCEPYTGSGGWGIPRLQSFYYGPQHIKPSGLVATLFSATDTIDFKNRMLSASGFLSERLGASKPNDKPHMWQGLRIGERVPFVPDSTDMSAYGQSEISLRIRGITAVGFDAFISEYSPNNFSGRMTVKRKDAPPETRRITTISINDSALGCTDVKYGQHFIRPDGNSDQYRKGGYHA